MPAKIAFFAKIKYYEQNCLLSGMIFPSLALCSENQDQMLFQRNPGFIYYMYM